MLRKLERDPGHSVRMTAYALSHEDLIEDLFLVTLRRVPELPQVASSGSDPMEQNSDALKIIDELRRELADAQAALAHSVEEWEAANEELKTSNEELQSGSEELQSVNEELETSNEELQSTNEELVTVNEALHVATTELTETNEELNAILSQVELPLLILDEDLNISKASTAAVSLFGITRPSTNPHVSQIPLPAGFPMIAEIARETMLTGQTASQNFVSGGAPYTVSCSAFTNDKGSISGVTLVFATSQAAHELHQLMEQMPAYLLHMTMDGTVIRASRRLANALGTSVEEMLGKNVRAFLATEDANALDAANHAFIRSGKDAETLHQTLQSSITGRQIQLMSERYRYVDDATGTPTIYSVSTDVSELAETERHLTRTNAEMQLILHHAPFFVLNRDVRGTILMINSAFADALGATVDEITGKNVREIFDEADPAALIEDDLALLSGQLKPGRKRIRLKLGGQEDRVFHTSRKILEDMAPDGASTICSVATEITDAVSLREAKTLMVRDLEAAIGQSNVSIMRLSNDGVIHDINDHGAERLGLTRESAVGASLDDFMVAEVAEAFKDRAGRFLRDTEASIDFIEEVRLRARPDSRGQAIHHWIRVPGEQVGADEIFSIARFIEGSD